MLDYEENVLKDDMATWEKLNSIIDMAKLLTEEMYTYIWEWPMSPSIQEAQEALKKNIESVKACSYWRKLTAKYKGEEKLLIK
ncbi:hypothetical protein ES708_25529 [subsurface metagenome]